jgi:hypothetical protein
MEGAMNGTVNVRRAVRTDQERRRRSRQHGSRARSAGHREDCRERKTRVTKQRVQGGALVRRLGVTDRVKNRPRLRQDQRERERDAGKLSWSAAKQEGDSVVCPGIVRRTRRCRQPRPKR